MDEPTFVEPASAMFARVEKARAEKQAHPVWGNWALDRETYVLVFEPLSYEIDLETITNSAQMLDWIFQIQGKNWATPEVVKDLLTAFQDLFYPQANLCSFGVPGSIDPVGLLKVTGWL